MREQRQLITILSLALIVFFLALTFFDLSAKKELLLNSQSAHRFLFFSHLFILAGHTLIALLSVITRNGSHPLLDKALSLFFPAFTLTWGVLITAVEQQIHSEISIFTLTILANATLITLRPDLAFFLLTTAATTAIIAISHFQDSPEVIRNHIINILGTTVIALIASIYLFRQKYRIYSQREKIIRQNAELKQTQKRYRENLDEIAEEVELAAAIQRSLLPGERTANSLFTTSLSYYPMAGISGDYFDFYEPSASNLAVFIADVSGHGIPAALIASMLKISFSRHTPNLNKPDIFMRRINREITGNNSTYLITGAMLVLNADLGTILYTNAGHVPLFVLNRSTGTVEKIRPPGRLLGYEAETNYRAVQIPLEKNTRFFITTDGILEQENAKNLEFSEIFESFLPETKDLPPEKANEAILEKLRQHSGRNHFDDDITLIVLDY